MTTHPSRPLKVGLHLPNATEMLDGQTASWSDLAAMARRAEELGFDSLWVMDHLLVRLPLPSWETHPIGVWECWSLLAALAASTERVELGAFVSCLGFRNPALLAKMAETIDEISGGRLLLGLGAGWHEEEFAMFGYPFDHRVGRFEEALPIISGLLRDGQVDVVGTYHRARRCELRPRGPRPRGLPILVGATGERMLRLTARYADGWCSEWTGTATAIPPVRERVDAACVAVGRDPATLERIAGVMIDLPGRGEPGHDWATDLRAAVGTATGTPDELASLLQTYADEGITHVVVWPAPCTPTGIEAFAPVLERLDRR